MVDSVESDEPDYDKVDGNDVIQQARKNQNQNACDKRNDRGKMLGSEGHGDFSLGSWLLVQRQLAFGCFKRQLPSSLCLCYHLNVGIALS